MARLKDLYFKELREKLKNKFELKNIFEVPKLGQDCCQYWCW